MDTQPLRTSTLFTEDEIRVSQYDVMGSVTMKTIF